MISYPQIVAALAAGAADPNCKKCYGRGTCGTLRKADGGFDIYICRCANAAFPKLSKTPRHISIPPEARR